MLLSKIRYRRSPPCEEILECPHTGTQGPVEILSTVSFMRSVCAEIAKPVNRNTANLVEGVIKFRVGLPPLIYDVFKRPDGKLPSVDDIMQAQPGISSGSGMVRIRSAIVSKVDHTRFRISRYVDSIINQSVAVA